MTNLWRTPLETVWDADRFDQAEWLNVIESIPQLSTADQQAARDLCGHPVQDGFFGLFKANLQLADEPATFPQPLAELLKRGAETPEWTRLRETTIGDSIAAGIGSQALVGEVLKALPEDVRQSAQQQAREQQKADAAQVQAEALTTLAQMLNERASGADEAAATAAQQAEKVQHKALQAQTQAAQSQARAEAARAAFQSALMARSAHVDNEAAGRPWLMLIAKSNWPYPGCALASPVNYRHTPQMATQHLSTGRFIRLP